VQELTGRSSDIEAKWQRRWYEGRINESERDARPKFMIIFAYPGVTGYLHVGHMRGFSYVDAIARYKRMLGFNVLFPVGTHATGNGAISLAKRIARRDERTVDYLLSNGCPESKLASLTDPISVVNFFNEIYVNDYWKRFGFLADWRRFTCTIFPDYGRFIQWQFRKLHDAGLLIQKPYFAPACVECGPVAIDASETDIQKGGHAEIQEYTLLKFNCGGVHLVAATLRPETVFGQTNFWVNPEVTYVKVEKDGETWVVSREAFDKMKWQIDGLELKGSISGRELIGKECIAPMVHRPVLVLPASFCDPNVGTGLVTSVPSDAPDDWIALKNLQDNEETMRQFGLNPEKVRAIAPIAIIATKGYGPMPAVELVQKMGITKSGDPRLEEAKKEIYKAGFHTGRMNATAGEFAGMPVDQAKEIIKQRMIEAGEADVFNDLSEEVICRCGGKVVIRKVPDQWFIDYANPELTARTKKHAEGMHILPQEYHNNVQGVLDWFRERACVRQGNWLGTRFPFDDKWIIEAISDSTLYPLYYLVSKYANEGAIRPEQMTTEFFDYVFLGKGDPESVATATGMGIDLLDRIRKDVMYWYPLDINLGGKEHMTVHFPAFLKNHVAILDSALWPQGIFVNWYIIGKGGKISKSKGGAQPIPGAAEDYGVDVLRLYYAHVASPFADVEWEDEAIENYRGRVERILKTVPELRASVGASEEGQIDCWLLSRTNSRVQSVRNGMEEFDLRQMATEVYFEMFNDLRWYGRRGGANRSVYERVMNIWVRMMVPITPHIAEELWESMGHKNLASTATYPEPSADASNLEAEQAEDYLREVLDDVNEILKVTGIAPKKLYLYVTPAWKKVVYEKALQMASAKSLTVPGLTKTVMTDPKLKKRGKEAADFARKCAEELVKRSPGEIGRLSVAFDEAPFLNDAAGFIAKEVGCEVIVLSADEPGIYDPQRKVRAAQPRRPAILVE
jgi:leucyl-tRNA synthetase